MGNLTHGMSIADIEALARAFSTESQALSTIASTIDGKCTTSGWRGSDADDFQNSWGTQKRHLASMATLLDDQASILKTQIDAQRAASDEYESSAHEKNGTVPPIISEPCVDPYAEERMNGNIKPNSWFDIGDGPVVDNLEVILKYLAGPVAFGDAMTPFYEKFRSGEFTMDDIEPMIFTIISERIPYIGTIRDAVEVNFPPDIADPLLRLLNLKGNGGLTLLEFGRLDAYIDLSRAIADRLAE